MSGFDALQIVAGWFVLIGASGAIFAFGVVAVCRWMNWAPVNTTIIINNPAGAVSKASLEPRPGEQA